MGVVRMIDDPAYRIRSSSDCDVSNVMHYDAPAMPHHRRLCRRRSGCVRSTVPRCDNCTVHCAPSPRALHSNGRTACRPSVIRIRRMVHNHHRNEGPRHGAMSLRLAVVAFLATGHSDRPSSGCVPSTAPRCANSTSHSAPSQRTRFCDGRTFCRPPADDERPLSAVSLGG